MSSQKATALIVRTSDWSETSRIVTLWTKENGRVRVLAKGGRRLRSNFEVSLDLLTVCSVVFIHKPASGLDLLTEARGEEKFPKLTTDLPALYCGYYIAELLSDLTQDMDPHPALFDHAVETLRQLGGLGSLTGPRLTAFELTLLGELGYSPALRDCVVCSGSATNATAFSAITGGIVCSNCQPRERDARTISPAVRQALLDLQSDTEAWRVERPLNVRQGIRQLLGVFVGVRLGKRPRLAPYLPA